MNTEFGAVVDSDGCASEQTTVDSDGDGVFDPYDVCPSSNPESTVDQNGCNLSQLDNDDLQRKVNQLEIDLSAIEITELRLLSALENGGHPGAESSILKIKGTEMQQALSELFVEASGEYALMYPGPHGYENKYKPAGPDYAAEGLSAFLNMRKTSIYGGSNEIQKNILSKFVLGV